MEYIATLINWVKANKKKTVVGLVVVLIVLNMLGVIGGEEVESAATTATTQHLCSGVCNHGLGI